VSALQPNQEAITTWFRTQARDLPWRNTNPWGVMVSEFMLQQTPVKRVLPRWEAWLERWPHPADLAQSSLAEAIRAWENLGYPRRAKRLHESATIITQTFNGQVPDSFAELRTLPGVGEYTANAILAFAFGQRSMVMDVNIRRLLARAWLGQSHQSPAISSIERALAIELLPLGDQDAASWAAASMELGALICTAREPLCSKCPIVNDCNWFSQGQPISEIPRKSQKRYEGSVRQERGRILKLLRNAEHPMKIFDLAELAPDQNQFESALTQLLSEGMVHENELGYSLPNS
jgi:A/G-specific adenine glycosylase